MSLRFAGGLLVATSFATLLSTPSFDEVARKAREARDAERLDEARRLYGQGVSLRPSWDEGWWYLATLAYEQDRFAEAAGAFERFLLLKPDSGAAWALRGLCEFRLAQHAQSLEHIRKGLDLGLGGNEELLRVARYHLALLLIKGGQFELALDPLAALARSEPESPQLVETIGRMLLRMPLFPDEVPAEKRAIVSLAGRAGFLHMAKQLAAARQAFEDLLARHPQTPYAHYAYGVFLLQQDSDEALRHLRKEIEIQPDSVYAYLDLAFELLRRGEPQQALSPAEQAVKIAPGLFASRNALGRALVETDALERGIAELEAAAALAPDSPEMHYSLARAYAKAGRKEDAEKARAIFTELDRKRSEARQPRRP